MRRAIGYALGIATVVHVTMPLRTAAGQDARPNACALVDAAEVTRLTGQKDLFGKGPEPFPDDEFPYTRHLGACAFVGMTFVLATNETPESFARRRRNIAPDRWKVQPISGLGDEAYYYWDARPGGLRSVLIVVRSGSKRVEIEEQTSSSDSIEVVKKWLLPIARTMVSRVK